MNLPNGRRKVVVIIYEYFYPGFLAGGPIQSLNNMVKELNTQYEFKIITSAFDLTAVKPYPNIRVGAWNRIRLPGSEHEIQVWYNDSIQIGRSKLSELIRQSQADVLFINGLFTRWSTWPLILRAMRSLSIKTIVSPRGMLQEGALRVKSLKKKLFLRVLKPVFRDVTWHATDDQERRDIQKIFGVNASVTVAANIPKHPFVQQRKEKMSGQLRLIFLSLITEKKNLHVALKALQLIKTPITFHIYGPVKDKSYWDTCQALMKQPIHEIAYQGIVNSDEVQRKLADYDALMLPTKGENFGHAIYEALSVGTPAIISQHTPWGKLQDVGAGMTVGTFSPEDWAKAIQNFIDLNQDEYSAYSKGSLAMAADYFSKNDFKAQYQKLFYLS